MTADPKSPTRETPTTDIPDEDLEGTIDPNADIAIELPLEPGDPDGQPG